MTDYLSSGERARLNELQATDAFAQDVLAQVDRIIASGGFQRVQQRARDFLSYVVAKTLLGEADQIKEMTVAMAVFGEDAEFNPAESSKVRTAASDLRLHLDDYARNDGPDDSIQIVIPIGTYVPDICDQRTCVTVLPFENWHPQGEQGYLCDTIAAEIAYRLESVGLRVLLAGEQSGTGRARYALRGTVEPQKDAVRISVSLAELETHRILLSRSFEGTRESLLRIAGKVADALHDALGPDSGNADALVPVRRRQKK